MSIRSFQIMGVLAALSVVLACDRATVTRVNEEPEDVMVHCRSDPAFPASALSGPTGAENGDDPPARVLRDFLARERVAEIANSSYRVLYRDQDEVLYGTEKSDYVVHVKKDGDWDYAGDRQCLLEVIREGHEVARWEPVEEPEGRSLHIRYETGTCYPGTNEDRFERAEIIEREDAVIITVLLRPEEEPGPPATGCAGVGLTFDRVIDLPSPVGDRKLMDGGRYPPHNVRSR